MKLWKSLFSHLVNVVTNNVMRAEEVGNMFGSLLISRYSSYRKEVRTVFNYFSLIFELFARIDIRIENLEKAQNQEMGPYLSYKRP